MIVPACNSAATLRESLSSLVEQKGVERSSFEIIVVDDGSTDDTVLIAEELADRVLSTSSKHGPSHARNTGADVARHEILAFLDSDDRVLDGWVAQIADAFADHVVAIATWPAHVAQRGDPSPSQLWYPNRLRSDGVLALAGCFAIDRSLFIKIGGYDENLRVGENSDLCDRALATAYRDGRAVERRDTPTVRVEFGQPPAHYDHLRLEAMEYLLKRDGDRLDREPTAKSKMHALAAVNAGRSEDWSRCRQHAWAAFRTSPRDPSNVARFAIALLPPIARRRWASSKRRTRMAGPAGSPVADD